MTNKQARTITKDEYSQIFDNLASVSVAKKIDKLKLKYRLPTKDERDDIIRRALDVLVDPTIVQAGSHRRNHWEHGWGENLALYTKTKVAQDISPKYFGKYKALRYQKNFIIPISQAFEEQSLQLIVETLFHAYLQNLNHVYEFGCGTGHHLLRARAINPKITLHGLDWAKSSQKIIKEIRKNKVDTNIYGHNFDFFHPNSKIKIEPKSAIYTVAALEQVGSNFEPFLNYLLKNKPEICFHIEPINEVLDEKNLLDYMSMLYFKKRNYLWGYLTRLRELESEEKIEILEVKRSFIGSLFIDGYTVIVWKPKS
jgi:hypothetical protein